MTICHAQHGIKKVCTRPASVVTAAILMLLLGACVFQPSARPQDSMSGTFSQALSQCRLQQPGRLNRRVHLPPTNARVAACLKRKGWLPDGTPVEARSDRRQPQ